MKIGTQNYNDVTVVEIQGEFTVEEGGSRVGGWVK